MIKIFAGIQVFIERFHFFKNFFGSSVSSTLDSFSFEIFFPRKFRFSRLRKLLVFFSPTGCSFSPQVVHFYLQLLFLISFYSCFFVGVLKSEASNFHLNNIPFQTKICDVIVLFSET